jgi:EAL domain-containing protein (putative c-di-GMP-specific phosphodiesterase class I)
MYVAKRAGTRVAIYDAAEDLRSPEVLDRIAALGDAIASDGLDLSYQPALRLVDGEVVRAEALVRWSHPTLGRLRPHAFVPLAERSGLSGRLASWVLRNALSRLSDWRAAGVRAGVSINVSARDLVDPAFLETIRRELAERHIEPSALTLDVSERALSGNVDRLLAPLHSLARLGVRIALDDFGSGSASLGLLRRLPLAEIKLDRGLIENMLVDRDNWSLVRSGIDLAHDLGFEVGAEGVEDVHTQNVLARLGCDLAQGRYFTASEQRESFAFLGAEELDVPGAEPAR